YTSTPIGKRSSSDGSTPAAGGTAAATASAATGLSASSARGGTSDEDGETVVSAAWFGGFGASASAPSTPGSAAAGAPGVPRKRAFNSCASSRNARRSTGLSVGGFGSAGGA